jgi:hypothetical protein
MAVVAQEFSCVRRSRLQSALALRRQMSNSTPNRGLTVVTSASNSFANMPDASRGDPPSPPPNPPPSPSRTLSVHDGYLG